MATFGAVALWLVWGGFRDPRALFLAGVFLSVASAFAYVPAGYVRNLLSPRWTLRPWWNALAVEAFIPLCLWCFVRVFPRVLHLERTERLVRAAIGTAAAAGVALFALNLARTFGRPPLAFGHESLGHWGVILALSAPALPVAVLRNAAADPGERRRVARFALGLVLGLGPFFLELMAEVLIPPFRRLMDSPTAEVVGSLVLLPALVSIPVVTAHAVVSDRLLDVRLILGHAARYLLARTTLSLLTLMPLAGLVLHLYEQRAKPLAILMSGPRGALLLSAGAAGLALLALRDRLNRRLDRAFHRSQADWPRVRLRLAQSIREGRTTRETADELVAALAAALGVETAAVLVAAHDRRWFVSLAGQVRPLRGDSALTAMTAAEPSPLSTDPGDPGSVFTLLPGEDQRWILDTQTALLAPLSGSDRGSAGLLALSPKRDQVPFTESERWEIAGICQAFALSLENRGLHDALHLSAPKPPEEELPATECRACRRVHPAEQERCVCGAPLVAAPLPRVLLGKLELQERLGAGGMGLVYRAFDRELERSVALKTLPRVSEAATRRLRHEARSMAAVSHPGVAIIYGVESWQGLPFLIVEHLPGGTLARRLGAPWPVADALRLGVDLADALDAIHRRGLLHRDVKPSNIGFDAEAHPKLLDFGLARLVEAPTGSQCADWPVLPGPRPRPGAGASASTWGLAGTPLYICPEVIAGEAPGPSQDLWGLTLVLYELIGGSHPFSAQERAQALERVRRGRLPDLRDLAPGCPQSVALLFARALDSNPTKRPGSAAALRSELRDLLDRLH
jgi:hypothetical protein